MASNKFLEFQEFSDADLAGELEQMETQYRKLHFEHAVKGLDNPLTIREADWRGCEVHWHWQ